MAESVDRDIGITPYVHHDVREIGNVALLAQEPLSCPVGVDYDTFEDYIVTYPKDSDEARWAKAVRSDLSIYSYLYRRVRQGAESGLIATDVERDELQQFEDSGLELTDPLSESISVVSLVDSIESGSLINLKSFGPQQVVSLSDVLHHHGIEVTINSKLLDEGIWLKQWRTPTLSPNANMVYHAAKETANLDYSGKSVRGPLRQPFESFLDDLQEKLNRLQQGLPLQVLQPERYQDRKTYQLLRELPYSILYKIFAMNANLPDYYDEIAETLWSVLEDQTIDEGTLDRPPFIRQHEPVRCTGAAFRMVFAGVTGRLLSESDLERSMRMAYRENQLHDEAYLKLFQSDRYKQQFAAPVKIIRFMGMDFTTLGSMAQRIKSADPDRKVFVTVNLSSATNKDKTIQHRAMLLGASADTISMHDPAHYSEGGADRLIAKEEFVKRWAATQNSGYLAVAL